MVSKNIDDNHGGTVTTYAADLVTKIKVLSLSSNASLIR